MQQALFQQATFTQIQAQVTRVSPGHGTGVQNQAINDETYAQEETVLKMTLSVLANVAGGALLLTAMFNLPVILAVIWNI